MRLTKAKINKNLCALNLKRLKTTTTAVLSLLSIGLEIKKRMRRINLEKLKTKCYNKV